MMFSVRINRIIGINSLVPTGERGRTETCVQCIYFGGCGRRAIKHGHSKSAPDMGCIIIGLHSQRALKAQREMRTPPAARYDVLPLLCRCVAGGSSKFALRGKWMAVMRTRHSMRPAWMCGCDVILGIAGIGINLIFQVLKTAIMERSGSRINPFYTRQTQSHRTVESRSLFVLWRCADDVGLCLYYIFNVCLA